ncbi:unnamed protein product [Merluccius merluccius]
MLHATQVQLSFKGLKDKKVDILISSHMDLQEKKSTVWAQSRVVKALIHKDEHMLLRREPGELHPNLLEGDRTGPTDRQTREGDLDRSSMWSSKTRVCTFLNKQHILKHLDAVGAHLAPRGEDH